MATFDEAYAASLAYFGNDELAAQKFVSKYALQDPSGDYKELTPDDMHRRLAREFARIEAKYPNSLTESDIFELLRGFKCIVPQGSPMAGIGNPYQIQSLSNCFVIESPYDSYGGILKTDQEQVQIMKRRGGVGFDLSTIRPKDMKTANAARTTDGIAVFMERWSNSCREVAQGGRRGALMLTISCHHPQIRDFINIKRDLKKVTGANISIRLSDEFMHAVKAGSKVQLRFPVERDVPHDVEQYVDATALWNEIIDAAHNFAEPGLLFWDTMVSRSPADIYSDEGFKTLATNPCAELPLPAWDACRLLLINLTSFITKPFTKSAAFDVVLFDEIVMKAQRLMDDLVDLEIESIDRIIEKVIADPEPMSVKQIELDLWRQIKQKTSEGRRTGLGVTGFGDMVAMMNMRYGSDDSIAFTEDVFRRLALATYRSSTILARERGQFKHFDYSREKDHVFMRQLFDADPELEKLMKAHGRRNIACNTTSPAGSVSLLTRTTSGIENVFMIHYKRRAKISNSDENAVVSFIDDMGDRWQEFDVVHPGFKRWMDVTGKSLDDIESSPYWKSTSADVDWRAKIRMQAAAQRWVDHALSNTTNVPNSTPMDVTKDIYMLGWELGCKGVTIYREGSRAGVLVSDEQASSVPAKQLKRPKELPCRIHHANVKGETWTILVGLMNGTPYELFGGLSKYVEIPKKYDEGIIIKNERKAVSSTYDLKVGNGSGFVIKNVVDQFENPNYSVMTRMISLSLRHGANIQHVVEQLQKGDKDSDVFSFTKVIARVLKTYIADGTETTVVKKCESCGGTRFIYAEGCVSCADCRWSKC